MSAMGPISRRSFLFGGAGAAGAAAEGGSGEAESVFHYDLSEYETTDPELLLYDEVEDRIEPGFQRPTCLAAGVDGDVLIGGDHEVAVYRADGSGVRRIALEDVPHAVAALPDGPLAIAYEDRIEMWTQDGRLLRRSESFGDRSYLTALAVTDRGLFLADAGQREVIHCDLAGRELGRFGKLRSSPDVPGFVVPSPYFDLAAAPDGVLRVANPGRHRMEAYGLDGAYVDGWGVAGMTIERFCGCCNPTHFCVLPDGGVVTSEKGLNRIKVYEPDGSLRGVVAGPDHLVEDSELARRACEDCHIGYSLPVAAAHDGMILALDPASKALRRFRPRAA